MTGGTYEYKHKLCCRSISVRFSSSAVYELVSDNKNNVNEIRSDVVNSVDDRVSDNIDE